MDSCVDFAATYLMNQQYEHARRYLTDILNTEPDNIDALYMCLNTVNAELVDYESYVLDGYKFVKSADSVLAIIEKTMQSSEGEDYIRYLFFTGNIYGAKGLVLVKVGDWIKGIKNARISYKRLLKARELDTTLYSADYGIGLFDYYVGQNLRWIPFMGYKARKGIAEIEKAANTSSPFSYAAKNSLSWILLEREDFVRADSIVSSVLAEYPNNTIFLRIKARIALLNKDYINAVVLGRKLVTLSQRRNPVNWSDLIDAYQIIVASLDAMGKNQDCLQAINKALNLEVPVSAKKISYVRKHLNYIHNMKRKIEQKL